MSDLAAAYAPGKISGERPPPGAPRSPIVFLWALFASGIASAMSLWQPWVRAIEQDELGGDVRSLASSWTAIGALSLLSPVFALLSDMVPLFGSRREGYLLLAGVLAMATWVAAPYVPHAHGPLAAVTVALVLATQVVTVSCQGGLAELGRSRSATGRLGAASVAAASAAGLASSALTAVLFQGTLGWTAAAGAVLAGTTVLVAILVPELGPKVPFTPSPEPRPRLRDYLRSRLFWGSLAVLAWSALPDCFWAMTYPGLASQDESWSSLRGSFDLVTSGAGLSGPLVYLLLCRRVALGRLLRLCFVVSTLAMLGLLTVGQGQWMLAAAALRGAASGLASTASVDLAVRAAPRGREAFGVTLLIGLGYGIPGLLSGFAMGVAASARQPTALMAVVTLLGTFSIRLLPPALVATRDGEPLRPVRVRGMHDLPTGGQS